MPKPRQPFNAAQFALDHAAELEAIGRRILASDFGSQSIINHGFALMGEARFVGKDDRWEQVQAHLGGWEYVPPPARLIARWRNA